MCEDCGSPALYGACCRGDGYGYPLTEQGDQMK